MVPASSWSNVKIWDSQAKSSLIRYPIPKSIVWIKNVAPAVNVEVPNEVFVLAGGRGESSQVISPNSPDTKYLVFGVGYEAESRKWVAIKNKYQYDMLIRP